MTANNKIIEIDGLNVDSIGNLAKSQQAFIQRRFGNHPNFIHRHMLGSTVKDVDGVAYDVVFDHESGHWCAIHAE